MLYRFSLCGLLYHTRVRDAFLRIAQADPARYTVIEAEDDIARVHASIVAAVNRRFSLQLPISEVVS